MNFLLLLLAVWALGMGGWFLLSKSLKKSDAERIKARLAGSARGPRDKKKAKSGPALLADEDHSTGKLALRLLRKLNLNDRLTALIEQAGLKWNSARTAHGCMALFLIGYCGAWLMLPSNYRLAALVPAALFGSLPLLRILRTRAKRLRKFEEQFPESLEFVARSMRAGHAFSVSLEMLHREFQEPLSGEFRRAFEEHNLGLPLEVALQKLAQRVPLLDVSFFVSAVLLQKRTGGNLAEILDKLAYIIRERFKLRGKIRAISAHGRMTGMALSLIPCAVAAILFLVNPGYVQFFMTDEVGNYMALAAVGLQMIGYGVIKKIVSIEV
jgi:tight adherence protein B